MFKNYFKSKQYLVKKEWTKTQQKACVEIGRKKQSGWL